METQTISVIRPIVRLNYQRKSFIRKAGTFVLLLISAWFILPFWFQYQDPTAGYIGQNIWLLLMLSIITFLLIIVLCWWLLGQFWTFLGLPDINQLIIEFNFLTSWQQLSFLLAFFSLLMLGAVGCILAIC